MLQKIGIEDLKPGMYVNDVVEQTGVLKVRKQGLVKSAQSIQALKTKGVVSIVIDLDKSELAKPISDSVVADDEDKSDKKTKPLQEQLNVSCQFYDEAIGIQSRFFDSLQANENPSLMPIRALSSKLIDSVLEMPSGMSCLTLLNKSGKYLLEHSLNCSILLTLFAHSREMTRAEIEQLSLAGILMDVGMTNMPAELLQSTKKLTADQKEVITTHVDIGLDLVERCGDISDIVRDVIFNHHERVDGSGYPDQQTDVDVSEYARMAAIVDSYDAMTSSRPFRKSIPPAAALRRLLQSKEYDQTLVAQFIQCLGVHPVGSLVKLDNNRLAIVVKGNKKTPLQPLVASFYHINSANYSEIKPVDLAHSEINIETSVRPEEFGLNLTKFFRDIFVNSI